MFQILMSTKEVKDDDKNINIVKNTAIYDAMFRRKNKIL